MFRLSSGTRTPPIARWRGLPESSTGPSAASPSVTAALAAQRGAEAAWQALSPDERAARWAEVRRRQRAGMREYQRWLWAGCPCSTPKRGSP